MIELSDKQMAEFSYRSYHAVDGLWFTKVEEKYGLDAALEIDNEVWKVLPKIQARMLKSMVGVQSGLNALFECFAAKLSLEGFGFEIERSASGDGFTVKVLQCPWHDAMLKSGREHLSGKINSLICATEYLVWASEFGDNIRLTQTDHICTGCDSCLIEFRL